MHKSDQSEPVVGKVMTSRELTEAIDRLITGRVSQFILNSHGKGTDEVNARMNDEIEVIKRDIADALKRLDHNPGVYRDDAKC